MRLIPFATLLALVSSAAATPIQDRCDSARDSVFLRGVDPNKDPVDEIRAHFARVIETLEARDVSHLTARQKVARRGQIDELAAYSSRGVFPINTIRADPTPIFIDDRQRACAVGHLMIQSGAAPLAHRIQAEQNLAFVPCIEVPGMREWATDSGLSLEECAAIQPAYICQGNFPIGASYCDPQSPNSTTLFGRLFACGTLDAVQNQLFFMGQHLRPGSTCMLLNSADQGFVLHPGGSMGNLCLGGAIGRHTSTLATVDQQFGFTIPTDLTSIPTASGRTAFVAGQTRHFQVWYRDLDSSHFTNGVSITLH